MWRPTAGRAAGAEGGQAIHDLAGNVWEWCLNAPAAPFESIEAMETGPADLGALRGGAFGCGAELLRCAFRYGGRPGGRLGGRLGGLSGFRVLRASPIRGR